MWTLKDICDEATPYQVWSVVEQGALKAFVEAIKQSNPDFILTALEVISHVLECGVDAGGIEGADPITENYLASEFEELGGVSRLEELQMHSNRKICECSLEILAKYYHTEEIANF